jgi:hypothetical protein
MPLVCWVALNLDENNVLMEDKTQPCICSINVLFTTQSTNVTGKVNDKRKIYEH